jgi:hypothetical protein
MKKTYEDVMLDPSISFNTMIEYQTMPEHLYKYQSFYTNDMQENKYWKDNIRGTFHLSLGREFEDYNDCKPYMNKQEISSFIENFLRNGSSYKPSDNEIKAICTALDNTLTQDYFEGVISNYQSDIRIGCFTESSDNFIMWEKYSSSKTGFCLEYSTSKNDLFMHSTLPVLYSDQPYNCSLSLSTFLILESYRRGKGRGQEEQLEIFRSLYEKGLKTAYVPLFIKEKGKWSFEEEYRMFLLKNRNTQIGLLRAEDILDENSNINLSNAITAIYLGENFDMNPNHIMIKNEILQIADEYKIKVYQKKFIDRTLINEPLI